MKYRRSLSALLALLLLVPSIVSCSPSGSGADTTDTNTLGNETAEGISVSEGPAEAEEPLDLPDRDFEGQKTLTPAYFDVALQRKYMSDEESRETLAIILENRTIDMAVAFGWGDIFNNLSAMTTSRNTDFASKYASISPTIESSMQKFVENVTGQ